MDVIDEVVAAHPMPLHRLRSGPADEARKISSAFAFLDTIPEIERIGSAAARFNQNNLSYSNCLAGITPAAMRPRDLILELTARRSRHFQRIPRYEQTKRRLHDLQGALYFLERRKPGIPPRHKRELYRYFPIALVAVAEGHFKMLYRDLIDSGEPFLTRAKGFRDTRFDFDSTIGLQRRSLTIGELISHQLPFSSMAHIDAQLTTLLDEDFPHKFAIRVQREDEAIGGTAFQTYMRRYLEELFRERHVYCHELATASRPKMAEASISIRLFRVFIQLIEEHVAAHTNSAKPKP